jgi:hypothetical protein
MEQDNRVDAVADNGDQEESEEHIHLPPPSWAPIMLALGLAGVSFGVVLGGVILVFGAVILLIGLGTWVYDEIKHASAADAEAEHPYSSSAS